MGEFDFLSAGGCLPGLDVAVADSTRVRSICVRWGYRGIFEVAEITSRMPSVDAFIEMVCSIGFTLTKKVRPFPLSYLLPPSSRLTLYLVFRSQDDSNTHFMMLSFAKSASESTWSENGTLEWEDVLKKGEEVLKACVYKKR